GFAIPQGTIRKGARCSTAKAFLLPPKFRENLHVLTFAYVTKILFNEEKRAIGVEFDRFSLSHSVYVRREVILSAGSINSPQLLMLSGVGPAEHLRRMKIPIVANLPVGKNLQDHIYSGVHFYLNETGLSLDQRRIVSPQNLMKYFTLGRGPLTILDGVEGLGFIKTKYANLSDDYPDVQIHMLTGELSSDDGQAFRRVQGATKKLEEEYFDTPDFTPVARILQPKSRGRIILRMGISRGRTQGISRELLEQYYLPFANYDTFSLYPVLLRPKSRGFIKLRSTSPYDPPIIDPKYLTHPDDILAMVDAMKISIAVGLTPAYRKFGSRLFERGIPGCERYPILSDEYLACQARTYTQTIYDPVGTCRMG
ncbi:glucose dehydrogenase (acceptor)-like protein 3, partial [Dinothrombium tinctorium]